MPYNDLVTPRDDIQTVIKAAWDTLGPPVPQLLYQDVVLDSDGDGKELPPDDESWGRVFVQNAASTQVTFGEVGNRRFRRFGTIIVQIFTPFGDGLTTSYAIVKVVVDSMEGKTAGGADNVRFRDVSFSEVGRDGPWFQANVTAAFEYDEVK